MSYEQIMSQLANLMKSGSKTNAFAPLIWLCSLVLLVSMTGIFYFSDTVIKYTFLGLIVVTILFCLIMYVVILVKNPSLLQSENYRIEHKKLDIIATKVKDIDSTPVDFNILISPNEKKI